MERSCERRSDILLGNISYPAINELRIQCEKLYSCDLDEIFRHKFGLSSSNMKKLKENLSYMERKGEYSVIIRTVSIIYFFAK